MNVYKKLSLATLIVASLSGCSVVGPRYTPNYENVDTLRNGGLNAVRIGAASKDEKAASDVEKLTIRGSSFDSPYGSYAAYLQDALRQELNEARLLDANSNLELSGVFVRNEFDASGFSVGFAELEARFVVRNGDKVRFDKVKSVRHEWESAFPGMIAIPKAKDNYPIAVRKLIAALVADSEFIAALKK